jgi:hypothetical protein
LEACTGASSGPCILGWHGAVATDVPTDVSAPVFLWSLEPATLIGYREAFTAGDRVTALGAVAGVHSDQNTAAFQLAIYSEVNSVPGLLLTATQDVTFAGLRDVCTNNVSVIKNLEQPFSIPTSGNYWVMILVGAAPVSIVANNSSAVLPIRCGNGVSAWPQQAPSLSTGAACLPAGDRNIGIAPRIYAVINPV